MYLCALGGSEKKKGGKKEIREEREREREREREELSEEQECQEGSRMKKDER